MVDDHKDGVLSIAHGEACDEVHCYLLEGKGMVGRWNAVCGGTRFVGDDFVLLTSCASSYIVGYPRVHPLPLTALFHPSYCFVSSWVAGRGVVVRPCHQRLSFLNGWRCVAFYCVNEFLLREYCDTLVVVLALVCSWGAR
jgi:hypothetical protein